MKQEEGKEERRTKDDELAKEDRHSKQVLESEEGEEDRQWKEGKHGKGRRARRRGQRRYSDEKVEVLEKEKEVEGAGEEEDSGIGMRQGAIKQACASTQGQALCTKEEEEVAVVGKARQNRKCAENDEDDFLDTHLEDEGGEHDSVGEETQQASLLSSSDAFGLISTSDQ